jgi:hypothetical protein
LLGERVARTPQRHSPLPKDFYFPSGFPTSKRARVRTSSEVEAAIARIHGVTAVRVLGDPRAREIHVVGERPAEELAAEVWLVTRRMLRGPLALDALNVVELEPA